MKVWTEAEIQADRDRAVADFVRQRLREPLDVYLDQFDDAQGVVEELLEETRDLTLLLPDRLTDEMRARLVEIVTDPAEFYALRYLAGPPVSADDLTLLSEADSLSRRRLSEDPAILDRLAQTVLDAHDRRRFPWLSEGRDPTEAESKAAALATAALIAYQQNQTWRRGQSGRDQEDMVSEALAAVGFEEVPTRSVQHLADAPRPGEFCRESKLRDQKADLLIGLWDRRTMAVECKVSNSSVNSYKRLNREAGGKAAVWLRELGSTQVVPASVLSGVYAMRSLQQAQDAGLSVFWTHDLTALTDYVETTRS